MSERIRVYSVAEANSLLPKLVPMLARQRDSVGALEVAVDRLRGELGDAPPRDLRPDPNDAPRVADLKRALRERIQNFREATDEIEACGVVVKDVRTGLVDFYGQRNGQLVWLCFQYGESRVAFWHPLQEGYSGRRPVEQPAPPRHLN